MLAKPTRLFLPFIVASMTLAACSSSEQVSYQSGGMTQTFVAAKDAEHGFLLPIYPNSKPTGEVQAKSQEEQNSFMMLSSPDPVKTIAEYYKAELAKQGWTVSQQQMLPTLVNMSAKKDKLEASIMLSADEANKTSITLSIGVEPEGTPEVSKEIFTPDKINPPTD